METIQEFISYLSKEGIQLWLENGRLCYRAPQGALSTGLLARMRDRKPELIHFLRRAQEAKITRPDRVTPHPREGDLPLSFSQERLWFLDQLEGASAAYNIPQVMKLEGRLQVEILEEALDEIIRRHESLRTIFTIKEGNPLQVIVPRITIRLKIEELRHLPGETRDREVAQRVSAEAGTPFNLAEGPLIRVNLLRLAPGTHVLLLTMHHIVSDGWSMGVLIRELVMLYNAYSKKEPSPLPPLEIQYPDFAIWQRRWLSGDVLARQLAYWKQNLADSPPLLNLPADRPRPSIQTYRGGKVYFLVKKDRQDRLDTRAREAGATLFMVLLGILVTLLYRCSGQEDILIGTPVANRNKKELEPLIGFFVNTLVLRADLTGEPAFSQLLDRLKQVTLDAYAHQDLPFEKLVQEIRPQRDLGHSPLFQVLFSLNNTKNEIPEIPGLAIRPMEADSETARFDLELYMEVDVDGINGYFIYNKDLFETTRITRMAGHFQMLAEGIAANPGGKISRLPLLTRAEEEQLLETWNRTGVGFPREMFIHRLFEDSTRRSPDRIAVRFRDRQLTYKDLSQKSHRLAGCLKERGVGPEVMVGICIRRTPAMLIGLLGILEAGGAYVPLDPDFPGERLEYMMKDSRAPVLVTTADLTLPLPGPGTHTVILDNDSVGIHLESSENLPPGTSPGSDLGPLHLAYVIYTSGSTGKPKGIPIAHRSLTNFLYSMAKRPGITSRDNLLAVTTISFDIAALELYLPLTTGAGIVLAGREEAANGPELRKKLDDPAITIMQATPATWRLLLAAGWRPGTQLKILCGGEALPGDLARQLAGKQGLAWNLYGPTETTIWSTVRRIEPVDILKSSPEPIGRGIDNTRVYILDKNLQPVPLGVPGVLYIGGTGLARGYLNRPELTAEKFLLLLDNYNWSYRSHRSYIKLYQTGDLACWRPDGNIEYLGRIDHQVKIRGFRIELEEIDAVLGQHPLVEQAVTIVKQYREDDRRLIAYVKSNRADLPPEMLKDYAREKLPAYMVPWTIVIIGSFPMTPNGKVDRKRLAGSDIPVPGTRQGLAGPRDHLELEMIRIWEEILDVHPLGITENFFDMGGHSLLLIRLMAKIKEKFQKELPLAVLFREPTIGGLVKALEQRSEPRGWSPLVKLQGGGEQGPFFCVHGIAGSAYYFYHLARSLGPGRPFYGIQAKGIDGKSEPITRIEEMAAYYIEAIRTVQPEGPYIVGGHSFGARVAYEMARQLHELGREVKQVIIFDTMAPYSYTNPEFSQWDDERWLREFSGIIERVFGVDLDKPHDKLQAPGAGEELNRFMERLEKVGVLPPGADIDIVRGLVRVYKTNTCINYSPRGTYPLPIALFKAADRHPDDTISEEMKEIMMMPTWGWDRFVTKPVNLYTVPGDHISMMSYPQVEVLARQVKECLDLTTARG